MTNLFKSIEEKSHSTKLEALKLNIAFVQRLVRDLESAFEVRVDQKRQNETTLEIRVYEPSQFQRSGWAFTFRATSEAVTFEDGRGIWLGPMAKILDAKIDENDYGSKEEIDLALNKVSKKIGVKVTRDRDSACGDHFTIKMDLKEDDKNLESKLKMIVATMRAQSVVSRL